jgi:hypothetical protein
MTKYKQYAINDPEILHRFVFKVFILTAGIDGIQQNVFHIFRQRFL